jgi:hypothetical protein
MGALTFTTFFNPIKLISNKPNCLNRLFYSPFILNLMRREILLLTKQLLYTLLAASIGFVAAVFFCLGTAALKRKDIVDLATSHWGYSIPLVKTTVCQSTQYLIGALLLIISFILQIIAALASSTRLILLHPVLSKVYFFVPLTLILVGSISYGIYRLIIMLRLPKILRAIKQQK